MLKLDYSLYYDYLFCTLKADIRKKNKGINLKTRQEATEGKFYSELTNYLNDDNYKFSKKFHRKGLVEYLSNIRRSLGNLPANDSYSLCNKIAVNKQFSKIASSNEYFFSFTPPLYIYTSSLNLLNLYVFDFSDGRFKERKAIISGVDYACLLYRLSNPLSLNIKLIKIHVLPVFKTFKVNEFSYNLSDPTKLDIIENRIISLIHLLYEIDCGLVVVKPSESRFNCSKCVCSYYGLCKFGDLKYLNTVTDCDNKQILF